MSLSALCWLNWSFLVTRAEEANDISVLANIFIERDYKIGGQHISVNEYSWLEPLRSLSEYIVQFSRTPTTIRETCSRIIKEKKRKKKSFFPLSVVWRNNRSKNVKTFTFGVCRARKRWTKEANVCFEEQEMGKVITKHRINIKVVANYIPLSAWTQTIAKYFSLAALSVCYSSWPAKSQQQSWKVVPKKKPVLLSEVIQFAVSCEEVTLLQVGREF